MKKLNEMRMIVAGILLFWVILIMLIMRFKDRIDGLENEVLIAPYGDSIWIENESAWRGVCDTITVVEREAR